MNTLKEYRNSSQKHKNYILHNIVHAKLQRTALCELKLQTESST